MSLSSSSKHGVYMRGQSFFQIILCGFCVLLLAACSTGAQPNTGEIADPLESYNRAMFKFNTAVDDNVLRPVAKGYRAALPGPVRKGVRNVITQLETPVSLANQILQGDIAGVGRTTTRFTVNTFVGFGGLFDVAGANGLKDEQEDFGQTLAVWGVGSGPYFVPPLFPSGSVRDQIGFLVDNFADPVRLYLMNTDQEALYYTRAGIEIIDDREALLEALDDLRKNSIDYYAAVRSATVQRRAALISDGAEAAIPDYDADSSN